MSKVTFVADGVAVSAEEGLTYLEALKENNIEVPFFCYSPKVKENGQRCHICVVEKVNPDGSKILVHSCHDKISEGAVIITDSPRLKELRRHSSELLLRRGPFKNKKATEFLENLLGDKEKCADIEVLPSFAEGDIRLMEKGCVLCGRCVAMCHKAGKKHLTFLGRGKNLRIAYVDWESNPDCGTCKACRKICPVGFIDGEPKDVFTAAFYSKNI